MDDWFDLGSELSHARSTPEPSKPIRVDDPVKGRSQPQEIIRSCGYLRLSPVHGFLGLRPF